MSFSLRTGMHTYIAVLHLQLDTTVMELLHFLGGNETSLVLWYR